MDKIIELPKLPKSSTETAEPPRWFQKEFYEDPTLKAEIAEPETEEETSDTLGFV